MCIWCASSGALHTAVGRRTFCLDRPSALACVCVCAMEWKLKCSVCAVESLELRGGKPAAFQSSTHRRVGSGPRVIIGNHPALPMSTPETTITANSRRGDSSPVPEHTPHFSRHTRQTHSAVASLRSLSPYLAYTLKLDTKSREAIMMM